MRPFERCRKSVNSYFRHSASQRFPLTLRTCFAMFENWRCVSACALVFKFEQPDQILVEYFNKFCLHVPKIFVAKRSRSNLLGGIRVEVNIFHLSRAGLGTPTQLCSLHGATCICLQYQRQIVHLSDGFQMFSAKQNMHLATFLSLQFGSTLSRR